MYFNNKGLVFSMNVKIRFQHLPKLSLNLKFILIFLTIILNFSSTRKWFNQLVRHKTLRSSRSALNMFSNFFHSYFARILSRIGWHTLINNAGERDLLFDVMWTYHREVCQKSICFYLHYILLHGFL